jgi:rod shape-determining protein MreB and related proteins
MIGVDLGTTTVRIHVKGKGVVLREPAVIAVTRGTTDIKAVGEEAYRMLGRTPATSPPYGRWRTASSRTTR